MMVTKPDRVSEEVASKWIAGIGVLVAFVGLVAQVDEVFGVGAGMVGGVGLMNADAGHA